MQAADTVPGAAQRQDSAELTSRQVPLMSELEKLPIESTDEAIKGELDQLSSPTTEVRKDGGRDAWMAVAGGFFAMFISFGVSNCYGVWQVFFQEQWPDISWAAIATIGGVLVFFADTFAAVGGAIVDAYGSRPCCLFGTLTMSLGLLLLSFSKNYWQVMLTLGVMVGLGEGFVIISAIKVISDHFHVKRGLAFSIVAFGNGVGGVTITLLLRYLNDHHQDWRDRVIAFMILAMGMIAAYLLKHKKGPRASLQLSSIVPKFSLLRDNRAFMWIALSKAAGAFGSWGIYIFLPTVTKTVVKSPVEPYLWAITQATSNVGRIIGGLAGDRIGHVNACLLCTSGCTIVGFAGFLPIQDTASALSFSILFGLFQGAWTSLADLATMQLVSEADAGSAVGISTSFCGWTPLVAPPIGALLVKRNIKTPFIYAGILWSVGWLLSACGMVLCRQNMAGSKSWKARL